MKIPDDVFRNRCAWCFHRIPGRENVEVPDRELFAYPRREKGACNIMGVCRSNRIEGECESFHPMHIYGICMTCAHYNSFCEDTEYCMAYKRPNRHRVFVGEVYFAESWQAALFTCDKYTPDKNKEDFMIRDAAAGRAPAIFDPDTMERTGENTETIWKRWREEHEEQKEPTKDPEEGQISLWD